jgi:serine/threonine protein kinase
MTTLSGRIVNGYLIQEEIGRGGMGVVFKARQLSIDRTVAIKFLSARVADDERVIARFMREAKAAGKLAHPNVVSVYDAGFSEGLHYIAMELVDGSSVHRRIREKGPLSEDETLAIAAQIAEALRFAHGRGVLHRDVKPDNFLMDSRGHVRIADLGLARFVGNPEITELTQDGTTLGTPQYMSPEQCRGKDVDARSDLYSLGASMYMMATGKPPFEGPGPGAVIARVLTESAPSLKTLNPKLSPTFVALIERLINKDPAARFADAGEVLRAIERCKAERARLVAPTQPQPQARTGFQLKFAALGGVCAIVMLIVLGNAAKRRQQNQEQPSTPLATSTLTQTAVSTGTGIEAVVGTVTGMSTSSSVEAAPVAPTREALARALFAEAEEAAAKKDRATLVNKLNQLSLDFADTDFFKAHTREISELPTK